MNKSILLWFFFIITVTTFNLYFFLCPFFYQIMIALRTVSWNRFIPRNKFTLWITFASVKSTILFRLSLNDFPYYTSGTSDTYFFQDRLRDWTLTIILASHKSS